MLFVVACVPALAATLLYVYNHYGKLTKLIISRLPTKCNKKLSIGYRSGGKEVARKAPQNARGYFAAFWARARRSDRAPCGASRLCAPKSAAKRAFGGVIALFDSPPAPPPCPLPLPRWGLGRGSKRAAGARRRLRAAFSARPRARKCAALTGGMAALLGGSPRDLAARLPPNERRSHRRAATNSSGNKTAAPRAWCA